MSDAGDAVVNGGIEAPAAQIEAAPEVDGTEPSLEAAPESEAALETAPPAAPETAPPAQDTRVAAKFAALARREKALKAREKQIEERLKVLEAASTKKPEVEAAPKKQELPLEYRLKTDPFNTLKELGIGYDKLTEMALNDGKLSPDLQMLSVEQKLREEFEQKYGTKISEYEKQMKEKEEQAEQERKAAALSSFIKNISTHINENKAELELLSVEGDEGAELVYAVMDEHYNATGEILDTKIAAQLVEDQLFEDLKKKLELQKVKSKTGTQSAPSKPGPATKPSVTLTNNNVQVSTPVAKRNLSDEESKVEAAKLIRWIEE